jgi:hypothetical protein
MTQITLSFKDFSAAAKRTGAREMAENTNRPIEPRIKREDLTHDPLIPGEPGVGFVLEYEVTRDQYVTVYDRDGAEIGWEYHPQPPSHGRGWQRVPGYDRDNKTQWRRFRPAIGGAPARSEGA